MWEKVRELNTPYKIELVERMRIFGGWLVRYYETGNKSVVVFVPDVDNKWELSKTITLPSAPKKKKKGLFGRKKGVK